jgi:penicillin-binding protein 2
MRRRIPIKDHYHEIQLITTRAITALVIMVILILLLITRLGYLQLSQNALYTTLSKKNWLDLVPVEPTRGLIYDRNGVLLAENIPVFSLDIIPDKIENMPQTLSEISKIIPLTDLEIAQFQKQLKQHRRFDEIPLKLRLTEEEVAKFSEHMYHFRGVLIKARLMRHYPFGSSFTHVLGYVGRINTQELNQIDTSNYSASNYIGKLGIEKYYEDELHGTVGYQQVESDASGEAVRVVNQIKTTPGENLYLTIDSKLQLAVEQAMEGHRGAVIAIDPSTGQILAMVSEPTYDPNIFVAGVSNQDFKTLQESPDRPLYNRALRGLYPPASTFKPFYALEGLNTQTVDTHYSIYDPGWFQLKNSEHIFRDWKKHGHGSVNLAKAITSSCDIYFFELASRLGIDRLDSILNEFGFGKLTGIDIGEELSGTVASPAWKRRVKGVSWYPGDTVISGIGQGFMQVTPLQLASGVATIANRGQRYIPYLLLSEQEPGKQSVPQLPTPINKIKLANPNYWNVVINAMQNVVSSPEGTAYTRFGKNSAYTVAGKTGTAQLVKKKHFNNEDDHDNQLYLPEKFRDNTLFIAFAPIDKPKIALAIVIENNNYSVGIARKILDYYLVGPQTLQPPTTAAASPPIATKKAVNTPDDVTEDGEEEYSNDN